jgi:hypothetical protein
MCSPEHVTVELFCFCFKMVIGQEAFGSALVFSCVPHCLQANAEIDHDNLLSNSYLFIAGDVLYY